MNKYKYRPIRGDKKSRIAIGEDTVLYASDTRC